MRIRETRTKMTLPVLAAALVSLAAACGSDDEPGSETDGNAGGSGEAEVELLYASFAAADSPHSEAFDELASELSERTDGRVSIESFHSGALCGFDEMIDCLRDGRADFSIFLPVQSPADFPLSSVSSVLFVSRDTWAHTETFNELVESNEHVRAEWEAQGIVPLYFASIGPAVLGTNEPVEDLSWLEGKSIRSTGYFTDALDVVGASPVAIPNADVYESIERGVIDAFYASTLDGAAIDNNHYEVTSHWYDLGAGEYATLATGMSQDAMDQLTAEEQDILWELVADLRESFWDEHYLPAMDEACDNALNGGVEVMESWSEDEVQDFADQAAEPIRERWISETDATGVSAADFFDTFVETIEEKEAESPLAQTATKRCAERAG